MYSKLLSKVALQFVLNKFYLCGFGYIEKCVKQKDSPAKAVA